VAVLNCARDSGNVELCEGQWQCWTVRGAVAVLNCARDSGSVELCEGQWQCWTVRGTVTVLNCARHCGSVELCEGQWQCWTVRGTVAVLNCASDCDSVELCEGQWNCWSRLKISRSFHFRFASNHYTVQLIEATNGTFLMCRHSANRCVYVFHRPVFIKSIVSFKLTSIPIHTPAVACSNLAQVFRVWIFPPFTFKRQDMTWN